MTRAEKLGSRGRPAPDGNVKANGNTDGLHNPRVCVKEESVPKESTRQRSRHLGGSAGGVSGSWLGPALGSGPSLGLHAQPESTRDSLPPPPPTGTRAFSLK